MKLRIWQVDAFASRVFAGNPAAVVPLKSWLSDNTMQTIAQETGRHQLGFRPLEREQQIERLTLEGELPLWLSGSLLRTLLKPTSRRGTANLEAISTRAGRFGFSSGTGLRSGSSPRGMGPNSFLIFSAWTMGVHSPTDKSLVK